MLFRLVKWVAILYVAAHVCFGVVVFVGLSIDSLRERAMTRRIRELFGGTIPSGVHGAGSAGTDERGIEILFVRLPQDFEQGLAAKWRGVPQDSLKLIPWRAIGTEGGPFPDVEVVSNRVCIYSSSIGTGAVYLAVGQNASGYNASGFGAIWRGKRNLREP